MVTKDSKLCTLRIFPLPSFLSPALEGLALVLWLFSCLLGWGFSCFLLEVARAYTGQLRWLTELAAKVCVNCLSVSLCASAARWCSKPPFRA